ncbi:HEXXH motif-containing putative peptide modification protein [Streptomyces sp. NPDC007861]|uniref:aKG-HExxH-type peptide beta-hydroxylase n=1 Tax=Streptomyces sp. NPDC007861 TaxID=3154893 RepID=UPI0033E18729
MSRGSRSLTEAQLRELGRTGGSPAVLERLAADQDARRLLLLRAILDTAESAPRDTLPPAALARLRLHWTILEEADRADRAATRTVLHYPLLGPWAQRCLRLLAAPRAPTGSTRETDHLGAVAAAAAVRAGLHRTFRLMARGGRLALPTLGVLDLRGAPGAPPSPLVELVTDDGTLTVLPPAAPPVVVRPGAAGVRPSADPRWTPVHLLRSPAGTVLLDHLDPYRTADSGLERHGLAPAEALGKEVRDRWEEAWASVAPLLAVGGRQRLDDLALLRCLVPLAPPPGAATAGGGPLHCSGTRREAFGAVLSSTPQSPAFLAATLVHELHHIKLSALAELTPLHTADGRPRHWAPWRPDPRPFDGLLQGTYSHAALADYWQRFALHTTDAALRDLAWAEHARCREQVAAVLPVIAGSRSLTPAGRILTDELLAHHTALGARPAPAGHQARAAAYVATARAAWKRRHPAGPGG